jgi:hypothetical protein
MEEKGIAFNYSSMVGRFIMRRAKELVSGLTKQSSRSKADYFIFSDLSFLKTLTNTYVEA